MQSNQVSGENNRSDFKGRQLKVYLEGGESFIADETAGTAYWSDYVGKHYSREHGEYKGDDRFDGG